MPKNRNPGALASRDLYPCKGLALLMTTVGQLLVAYVPQGCFVPVLFSPAEKHVGGLYVRALLSLWASQCYWVGIWGILTLSLSVRKNHDWVLFPISVYRDVGYLLVGVVLLVASDALYGLGGLAGGWWPPRDALQGRAFVIARVLVGMLGSALALVGIYDLLDTYAFKYILAGYGCVIVSRTLYAMAFVYPPDFKDVWPVPTWESPLVLHVLSSVRALVNLVGQSLLFIGFYDLLYPDAKNLWTQGFLVITGLFFFLATNTFLPNGLVEEEDEYDGDFDPVVESCPALSPKPEAALTPSPTFSFEAGEVAALSVNTESLPALRLRLKEQHRVEKEAAATIQRLREEAEMLLEAENAKDEAANPSVLHWFVHNPFAAHHPRHPGEVSVYFLTRTLVALSAQCVHGVGVWNLLDVCMFSESVLRNSLYVVVGLLFMALTGTLMDNACISPMQANMIFPTEHLAHSISVDAPVYMPVSPGNADVVSSPNLLPPSPRHLRRRSSISSATGILPRSPALSRSISSVSMAQPQSAATSTARPIAVLPRVASYASMASSGGGGGPGMAASPLRFQWNTARRRYNAVKSVAGGQLLRVTEEDSGTGGTGGTAAPGMSATNVVRFNDDASIATHVTIDDDDDDLLRS